jgi:type II secretory pathway component GspD/PulD (secretin)
MDIPVVGGAFRTTTNDNTRTEIVILLTPHIVGNKENYVDRENAKDRTVMPDKAY